MDINNIILSSRIRLARNINNMPFPNKQNELSANDVLDTVCGLTQNVLNFHTFKLRDLDEEKIAYYIIRGDDHVENTFKHICIFRALGARHLSRVDFFVTKDEKIIFNEINTLPGFTSISMYPKLAEAGGVSFDSLVNALIEEALS